MALINWTDDLKTGADIFDEQHKNLVNLINRLHEGMAQGKGRDILSTILSDLVSYTEKHFAEEERAMQHFRYPGYADQVQQHKALKAKVVEFRDRFSRGQVMMTPEVMNFLRDWLTQHIQRSDKQYGPFFKQAGFRQKTPQPIG